MTSTTSRRAALADNIVKLETPAATDAALIRECVAYAQTVGGLRGSFQADPDGDSKYAAAIAEPLYRKIRKSLRIITTTPAKSAAGLQAKAKIAPMLIKHQEGCMFEAKHIAFFAAFAAEVEAYLGSAVEKEWRAGRDAAVQS